MNWKNKKTSEDDFVGSGDAIFKKIVLKDFASGRFLTKDVVAKQLPFFLFLTFLAFVYISNHFKVEKLLGEAAELNKELTGLRIESITTSSDLMYVSKRSVILSKVREEGLDLEELTEPPRKLVVIKK